MKKILNIGGDDVAFECNAVTSILYKNEFNKNFFSEIIKLNKLMDALKDPNNVPDEDIDKLDLDIITRLAWACAMTALRSNTVSYMDWIMENKDFNIMNDGVEIFEIIAKSFETKKK